ncbi:hypothetical protein J2S54_006884 [Streptomyces sp. DSM 42143]|uniref:hypothetical protein n=1 Tax=Streptomyces sp. DSM 42143 TaxID=2817711 RepID=UPI00278036D5|nr:hypothetical protein [Streptomyces sp. DSM 42143]MDQ0390064.1 hypothetical protein [Streptomyces sp. DSM 42143]
MGVVLEDRVGGQDRLVDAPGQLCPVGGAVVDGAVDGQERGPVTVEFTEGVLGIEGAVPQLARRLVLRCGHQPQPCRLPVGSAGRGSQGPPGPSPELPARLDLYVQGCGGAGVVGAHAALGVRVSGRRVHQ